MIRTAFPLSIVIAASIATAANAGPPQPQCCGSSSSSKKPANVATRPATTPRVIVTLPPTAPSKTILTAPTAISETANTIVPTAATKPAENTVELSGILCSANHVFGHMDHASLLLIVRNKGRADYYHLQQQGTEAELSSQFADGSGRYATIVGAISEKDGKKFLTPAKVAISRR